MGVGVEVGVFFIDFDFFRGFFLELLNILICCLRFLGVDGSGCEVEVFWRWPTEKK